MIGISRKEAVGFPILPQHMGRKAPVRIPEDLPRKRAPAYNSSEDRVPVRPARCSDRAQSPRRSSRSSDSGRANSSDQLCSDSSSAKRNRANLSCSSSSGSSDALSKVS